jgi:hypothetical protein
VVLILLLMVPAAVFTARWAWRLQLQAAELLETAPVHQRTGTPRVRITAVLVADRSLLVGTSPATQDGVCEPSARDQVIVGELCDSNDDATVAVLNNWRQAGTLVTVHLIVDRVIIEAPR